MLHAKDPFVIGVLALAIGAILTCAAVATINRNPSNKDIDAARERIRDKTPWT